MSRTETKTSKNAFKSETLQKISTPVFRARPIPSTTTKTKTEDYKMCLVLWISSINQSHPTWDENKHLKTWCESGSESKLWEAQRVELSPRGPVVLELQQTPASPTWMAQPLICLCLHTEWGRPRAICAAVYHNARPHTLSMRASSPAFTRSGWGLLLDIQSITVGSVLKPFNLITSFEKFWNK